MVLGLTHGAGAKVKPAGGNGSEKAKRNSGGSVKVDAGKHMTQTADAAEFEQSRFVGVKSYLHQFYASPTMEAVGGEGWYLLPAEEQQRSRKNRWAMCCAQFVYLTGFLLLLAGAGLIIYAYVHPKPSALERLSQVGAAVVEEQTVYASNDYAPVLDTEDKIWLTNEQLRKLMQDPFHDIKLAGILCLAAGGALLVLSVLPTLCTGCRRSDKQGMHADIRTVDSGHQPQMAPYSPTSKVPYESRTSAVQPSSAQAVSAEQLLLIDDKN